ncbi:MAG: phosphoglucosamine mutase [Candidatus Methanomethyliaceae archaeon]
MKSIIGTSGIRGIALEEISIELCIKLGLIISNWKKGDYVIGHDVRLTSPLLANAMANGICAGGSNSIFMGLLPTPAIAFYSQYYTGGIAITASHNPPEYNGIKIFNEMGAPVLPIFYEFLIKQEPKYVNWDSLGYKIEGNGFFEYIEMLLSKFNTKKKWKICIDPGNGATSLTAPLVFRLGGHEVYPINIDPDGKFPGRGPEPNEESLKTTCDFIRKKSLDIGFAYDGDGDRVVIIDENGNIIPQDIALAQMAKYIVKKFGGPIVVNIDTSTIIDFFIKPLGSTIYRTKVGDPYVVDEVIKRGAFFGGESCGAWIFPNILKCPDGVLSSIILLNFLDCEDIKPSDLMKNIPNFFVERLKIRCQNKFKVIEKLKTKIINIYPNAEVSFIDGIRISWEDFTWALVRASGTEPLIRITVESPNKEKVKNLISSLSKIILELMGD